MTTCRFWLKFTVGISLVLGGFVGDLYANPTGGNVSAGSASIAGQGTSTVTINQASNTAVINWQSFSINAGETTKFVQPSSTSSILNRVLGGQTSIIDGTLSANGQVYLVNGNGVIVGPGGVVNANAFTASTRNITDTDFLSGNLHFTGNSNAGIQNFGKITALGGDVVLIGQTVDNRGTIKASRGTAGLVAGNDVLLAQKNADGSTITVSPSPLPGDASGKVGVHNSGMVRAAAAELKAANGNIYSMAIQNEGVIRATTVTHQGGHIWLTADSGSLVNSGTLNASAKVAGGKGGSVVLKDMGGTTTHSGKILAQGGQGGAGGDAEVSGDVVHYSGTVDLTAVDGTTGSLLFDPENVTIQTSGSTTATASGSPTNTYTGNVDSTILTVADLQAALANANITVITGASGSQAGDITVANSIAWSNSNTLTLSAFRNIVVNNGATISNSSGGSLNLNADNTGTGTGTITFGSTNQIAFSGGGLVQFFYNPTSYTTPTNYSTAVSVSGGTVFVPYMLVNNLTNLQAMSTNVSGNYALGRDIDATGSAALNSGAGFSPISTFAGKFNGQNHVIDGLTINRPSTSNIGLFGVTGAALIQNVSLTNVNIKGSASVGALVGQIGVGGVVQNSSSSGTVNGAREVGGLVGYVNGGSTAAVKTSHSSATVTSNASSQDTGGLVGENNAGQILNSYSTGAVSAGANSFYLGGLVGQNAGATGVIQNSTSSSTVTAGSSTQYVGGLVGLNNTGATIKASYSNGSVNGGSSNFYVGGLAGGNVGTTEASYTTDTVTPGSGTQYFGGLIGNNTGGTSSNNFWDTTANPTFNASTGGIGLGTNSGATGKTLAELQTQSTFTPTGTGASQWDFTASTGSWTINAGVNNGTPFLQWQNLVIVITLTALDQSATYAGVVPSLPSLTAYTITGGTLEDLLDGPTLSVSGSNVNAGTTDTIDITATPKPGFSLTFVDGTLTITPAPLTITANDQTKIYGQTLTFNGTEFTPTGLQNEETIGSVKLTSNGAVATAGVGPSPYAIKISKATGGTFNPANYDITYVNGSLTINPAELTITANDQTKTYGQTFTFNGTEFTSEGLVNGETIDSAQITSNGAAATSDVGPSPYAIRIGHATGENFNANNYDITYVNGSLTVNPAELTITANDQTKTYGQTFTFNGTEFTSEGLVNGDTIDSAQITSNGAAATADVGPSPYAIKIGHAAGEDFKAGNYDITYVNGSLTVNPASLTITANDQTKTYGQTFTFNGTEFTSEGLVNGDTIDSAQITSNGGAATASVEDSPYIIKIGHATGEEFNANNYDITYVNGKLTIGRADLTITANDQTKTYGQTFTFNGTEFTSEGLVNGETIDSAQISSNGAVATADVGPSPYKINIANASGDGFDPNNYNVTYVKGNFTVDPATLTITANDQTKTYGQTFTFNGTEFTSQGLQNEDSIDSAQITSNGAAATADVGPSPYVIKIGHAQGENFKPSNYDITYVNGSLTINPAELTITANDQTKTYGQTFTFNGTEFTSEGLVNGETIDSAQISSNGAVATADVGPSPYVIRIGHATGENFNAHNYDITYVNGSLTVNPASLIITANDQTKTYGQTFTFNGTEFTSEGLVNGETIDSAQITSNGAAATADVGPSPYVIRIGHATGENFNAHNYDITYVNGSLTVNPASLTITANDQTKTYGQTFTFNGTEFTSEGLVNDETIDSVKLTSKGAIATADVADSPYKIKISDATGEDFNPNNYDITYVNGSLTINPAELTITANNQTKTYGQTFTFNGTEFTSEGLQNDDSIDSVQLNSKGADAGADVAYSPYKIHISHAKGENFKASNYAITYVNGSLTINPAELTITANDQTKIYGQTFTFDGTEFTSEGLVNGDIIDSVHLGSRGAKATANVANSPYKIRIGRAKGENFRASNYDITYVTGNLTVDPAPLTITANDITKIYGQTVTFNGTEFTSEGLVNGDTIDLVQLNSKGADAGAYVRRSPYKINIGHAQGENFRAGNYDITYVDGSLIVNPATLTYVATPVTVGLGQPIPPLDGTVIGFVNGDTLESATKGTLTFKTPATSSSPEGFYPINGRGLKARHRNYIFVQAPGNATALQIGTFPFGSPTSEFARIAAQFGPDQGLNTFFTQTWFPLFDPDVNDWFVPVFSPGKEPHPVYPFHGPHYAGDNTPGGVIAFGSSYQFQGRHQGGIY